MFIYVLVVESKEENRRKKRQFRSQVCLALDIDKHVLRQLKGRRLDKMQPGEYKSTLSSKHPVVIEKHWQEPTVEEHDKHMSVHKLQVNQHLMFTTCLRFVYCKPLFIVKIAHICTEKKFKSVLSCLKLNSEIATKHLNIKES